MRAVGAFFFLAVVGCFASSRLFAEPPRPQSIRVVLDDNYPPFVFRDDEGRLQGILIDQWGLWEKKTGIKVDLQGMDWGVALKRMEAGEFDVIDTIFETEERARYLDFAPAYEKIAVPIFFRKEISGITDARSLRGFPVGVKSGDAAVGLLRDAGVATLLQFDSYEAVVQAARDCKVAVFVVDKPPALYYLYKLGIEKDFRQSAPLNVGEFHRSVARGRSELLQIIEAGFATISKAELKAIDDKWYGVAATVGGHSLRVLLLVAGAVGLLVAVLFVANVTLRRAVRTRTAELKTSEARFQSIYHSVNDAIFIHDLNTGRILDMNNRAYEMFGCTVEEVRAATANQFSLGLPPYTQVEALGWLKKAAAGNPQVFPWRSRRKDGSLFWSEVRMRRARVGDEDAIVVTVSDIDERKKAEAALNESTERFRQMAENIDEVFWMTGVGDDKLLYVSPAYEKIWGRSCESLYADPGSWAETIHPDDRPRVLKSAAMRQPGEGYIETYRILRPEGQIRWIEVRAFSVRDFSGQVYRLVGTAADITEHRTLEAQFQQAQKMEALGTLAGGIAHDFNNILGAITGYAELAKLDSTLPSVQNCHEAILSACSRASDLVRQILAFSRQQEQKRKPLQLAPVVTEAIRLLRAVLPATAELTLEMDRKAPAVLADPTQIHQVVMNLCTNSVQALGARAGWIKVGIGAFEADGSFARMHPGGRIGRYACLSVSDNGHGMEQPMLDRIFEPFFTTKAPGEGTGLGLAVVHGIVRNHEGIVTVESQPGTGTTFRLYFPEYAEGEVEASPSPGPVAHGSGQRILLVDDEEPIVQMTGRILAKLGYKAETETDPVAALAAIRAAPDKYDLIITDLTMPHMTGLEFAACAIQEKPQIRIVLMTGFFANLTDEQLQAAGIKEVLLKPVTLKSLSQTIERLLRTKT